MSGDDDVELVIDIACAILDRQLFLEDAQADEDEAALAAARRVLGVIGLDGADTPKSPRQLIGSIGGHTSWARTEDRTARTAPGRKAFLSRFEHEVDPDGALPPDERLRRAEIVRKAHMKTLAQASVAARRARASGRPVHVGPPALVQALGAKIRGQVEL